MSDPTEHWDRVYRTKGDSKVSWYQARLETSLALVRAVVPDPSSAIIDVGGGSSMLVDSLLEDGYTDLTVLDLSETALRLARTRLGDEARKVSWIVDDVTRWRAGRTFDVWHDRAVFHFLTETSGQDAYLATLKDALAPGGHVVMATFALAGPEQCSGLPVQRYSPATLAARFGPAFRLVTSEEELHRTPSGVEQLFSYAVLKRR